jgi:ABC-type phosphate transport system substrate-binding protein
MPAQKYRTLQRVVLTCVSVFTVISAYGDIAVVVHPSNTTALDKSALERIYMGKTNNFNNGRAALPINATKGTATRAEFNKLVIERSDAQINAYWSKLLFTGKGTPPKELATDQEIIATVSANEDAVGYVDSSAVTDSVKVVATFQ